MKTDGDILKAKSEKFITIMKRELSAISQTSKKLGENIKIAGDAVGASVDGVVAELHEMNSQMGKPLSDIRTYLRRLMEDEPVYIPFNAGMALSLLVSRTMVRWMQTFAGEPENPTLYSWYGTSGHGAVLEEVIEGFREVGEKLVELGGEFKKFGQAVLTNTTDLENQINDSTKLIEQAFYEYMDSFYAFGYNLSYRLKGEPPPA